MWRLMRITELLIWHNHLEANGKGCCSVTWAQGILLRTSSVQVTKPGRDASSKRAGAIYLFSQLEYL